MEKNCWPPVAITKVAGSYPTLFPFDPHLAYPEYPGKNISPQPNSVYDAVRTSFNLLGYDCENFGTSDWNPLGFLIKPGDRVFIKPNLVTHEYRQSCGENGDLYSVITHPSVIRVVADYAFIALKGQGEIIIGDNPSIDADFEALCRVTKMDAFAPFYEELGVPCRVLDLRPMRTNNLTNYGFKSKTLEQTGDPEGNSVLNLGRQSYFYGLNPLLFRGVFTKRWETIKHHHGQTHEYSISNTILNSNVYISIPKLKAHHKVGATLNIKGLVGINANKNYLIHWRIGFPKLGGDEFSKPLNWLDYLVVTVRHLLTDLLSEGMYARLRDKARNTRFEIIFKDIHTLSGKHFRGAWAGNDTTWRMAADLYNVFIEDKGRWRQKQGRTMQTFSVVDGVVAGEGNGPFCPQPKQAQVIISGQNLLLVDCVSTRLMDYRLEMVKYLDQLIKDYQINLKELPVISADFEVDNYFTSGRPYLQFKPPSGWPNLSLVEGYEA